MKKWTGCWLECRIHSFWSVHSKGQSWQLTQRPLQKNRSLTLTTVWGENVSGPEHCQNPPVAVCNYWSGMRERNRELKTGRKKEGLREKETSELGFCLQLVRSKMGGAGREYICYQNSHWKGSAEYQNKVTWWQAQYIFLSIWMVFPLRPTGIFKSGLGIYSEFTTVNLQSEPIWSEKIQQRVFLCSETFINGFEMCHFHGYVYDCYMMCFMDMSIVALDGNCVTYLLHKLQYISCI